MLYGKGQHSNVIRKLSLKRRQITDVIDSLVESTSELRSNCLKWDPFVGQHRQNHEQLGRGLWLIGFVHADFNDTPSRPATAGNESVELTGLLAGQQICGRNRLKALWREMHRRRNARNRNAQRQLGMPPHKRRHIRSGGRPANAVGHIDCEKIADRQKPLDRVEPNVIGIHKPRVRPSRSSHGLGRRHPHAQGLAPNEGVFTVGFIPHRSHHNAVGSQAFKGRELRASLVGKAIADAKRKPGQQKHGTITRGLNARKKTIPWKKNRRWQSSTPAPKVS